MGFGTLFFGYCLLLVLPLQEITNLAAAATMLFALYKLAYLNPPFKRAYYACLAFGSFALADATLYILDTFFISLPELPALSVALYLLRNFLIGTLSVLMLIGMRDVASEVGLKRLSAKCGIYSKISLVIYVFNLLLSPELAALATGWFFYAVYVMYVLSTIATLFVIVMNLTCIHSCYARICMPEELEEAAYTPKKSRFGFVNKFRDHEARKRQEYAEYKLEKRKSKSTKKRK